ncbi:MAG: potassium transporter KefB [Bacteroidota bacterium]
MEQTDNLQTNTVHPSTAAKPMIIGAVIGLAVISMFLFSAGSGKPEWGAFWKIRPLIVTPFAGAMGGLVYYFMDHLRVEGGWKKVLANIVSILVFIIGLWMGIVLGLAGTLWD